MNFRRLVRAVVVENEMDVELARDGRIDGLQEMEKLGRPMPAMDFTDDAPRLDIERGKEVGRPMPHIVVRVAFDLPGPHRQERLRAIQRLDLRLLVDGQHQGAVRRIEIEPDDVAHLLDEQRIFRDLERFAPMGLECKGAPDPAHRALTQPGPLRHGACAPVRRIGGQRV